MALLPPACRFEGRRPPLLVEIGGAVKIRCYGEFFRCSVCKIDSGQRFEFTSIFASGGAAETPRLAKSAVFAAVTSKSGRRFSCLFEPWTTAMEERFATGSRTSCVKPVAMSAGPEVLSLRDGALMSEVRRLAAILVADVVGYSRLAGADEEGTLARLRALWSDLLDPAIAARRGRVVKRTGDGAIAAVRSPATGPPRRATIPATLPASRASSTPCARRACRGVKRRAAIGCEMMPETSARGGPP